MKKAQITVERKWNIRWRKDGLCSISCPGAYGTWGTMCHVFGVKRRSPKPERKSHPALCYRCPECIAATEAKT